MFCDVSVTVLLRLTKTNLDDRNPDERPTASELRRHRYLEPIPGWYFTSFT
jgi:hypothetical protein